ncbi:MAG: CaiB/BaiF CoA-transferase family protein [Acidimicrobiales bacterium]
MIAPLENITVVAWEQAVAAPFATRQLADLGARVLKIERPGSGDLARHYDSSIDGQSAFFVWANRGKDSITLDVKDPADAALLDRLIAGADVFIHNVSPAAAHRAGRDAAALHERYPQLIACEISGYGQDGPRTNDKAYDLAIQAESGAMAVTGSADSPSKIGFSAADISAGMYAFSSILAALYRRQSTGEGAAISISMLECLSEWMAAPTYAAVAAGSTPTRVGHRHAMIAPYGVYTAADGAEVLVAVQAQHEWESFTAVVLGQPELTADPRFATNPDRVTNIDALERVITAVFGSLTGDEIRQRLSDARVAFARVNSPIDAFGHEQRAARHRQTMTTPTKRRRATSRRST